MKGYQDKYTIDVWRESRDLGDSPRVTILYVVLGSCSLRIQDQGIPLNKGDAFVVNYHQPAKAVISEGSLVAALSLEYFTLCQTAGVSQAWFSMSLQDPQGHWYRQLRQRVESLILASTTQAQPFQELGALGEYYFLVQLLFRHFSQTEPEKLDKDKDKAARLLALLRGGDLSLQEMAAKMYLSPAAVSRLFHKVTGENFSQYKQRVRLERVKGQLVDGQKPVTVIAMEAGFTSSTVFNRAFKEAFGVTPSQYRKEMRQQREGQPAVDMQQVLAILEQEKQQDDKSHPVERVEASTEDAVPWKKWPNRVLNVGPAHLLQSANMQNQVDLLAERLDIEYIRIWSLFSQQMMFEPSKEFNFSFLDAVLDFCVDRRLKLHLDLAQRRDFSLASESSEIYSRDTPEQQNWFQLVDAFLHHIRLRYTERVVSQWVFEFSFYLNEPYDAENGLSDLEVWERGYALIKSVFPKARVAGPGLIASSRPEEAESTILQFLGCGCPPDIFTSVCYPYDYEGSLEGERIYQKKMTKVDNRDFLWEQTGFIKRVLAEHGFAGEYWVTDWGFSLANRNYVQDSCFRGTSILEDVLKCQERVDALGVFCASDILSAYGDASNVLSGSAGLLSQTGIRKPAYYAYRFLHSLGRYKLCQTEHCVVTQEGREEIRVLCFNGKALGPKYYLLEENAHQPDDLDALFVDLEPLELELTIQGLEGCRGPYYVRQRILNEKQGSPLRKWISLGCVSSLSRDDIEFLERTSVPDVTLDRIPGKDGKLRLRVLLEPNELRIIVIN